MPNCFAIFPNFYCCRFRLIFLKKHVLQSSLISTVVDDKSVRVHFRGFAIFPNFYCCRFWTSTSQILVLQSSLISTVIFSLFLRCVITPILEKGKSLEQQEITYRNPPDWTQGGNVHRSVSACSSAHRITRTSSSITERIFSFVSHYSRFPFLFRLLSDCCGIMKNDKESRCVFVIMPRFMKWQKTENPQFFLKNCLINELYRVY